MAITDLTNTTWTFNNSGIRPFSNTGRVFSVEFSYNSTTYTKLATALSWDLQRPDATINFGSMSGMEYIEGAIYYLKTTDNYYIDASLTAGEGWYEYDSSSQITIRLLTPPTITITGGTDVTDSTLNAWLEANAEQQAPTPDVTFDLSTLNLPAGTYTVTVKAEADGFADSVASNSVTYVTAGPAPSTITFTIESNTYTADDGMTWSQWAASNYNTINAYDDGSMIWEDTEMERALRVGTSGSSYVHSTDAITANGTYSWKFYSG